MITCGQPMGTSSVNVETMYFFIVANWDCELNVATSFDSTHGKSQFDRTVDYDT